GRRKVYTTAEGFLTRDLLHFAWGHLASAKALFEKSPDCYDSAGYLSHIGVELLLKAVLLHRSGSFPNEHDLPTVLRLVRESHDIVLSTTQEDSLRRLYQFEAIRYPAPAQRVEIGSEDW